jgi:hypothetical protein
MLTKHVTASLEAYLDNHLAAAERHSVEAHLAICPACKERLYAARRLADELRPTLIAALGQPNPSPALRQRVRRAVISPADTPRPRFDWAVPGRALNAVGTLALIGLLAFGVWTVIQGQLPGGDVLPDIVSLSPGNDSSSEPPVAAIPSPTSLPTFTPAPTLEAQVSISDTLPPKPPLLPITNGTGESTIEAPPMPMLNQNKEPEPLPQVELAHPQPVEPPAGTIAFAYFNQAPDRQVYETHFINTDGSNHRLFGLDGVSEPALRAVEGEAPQLAYRAYSEPTSPRSLLSGDLDGKASHRVGGFFEDAQPDWSPREYRLIYASQRETDRRWRLYTSWGDGSNEFNLRREGKSPTFAPDGDHFAFEGCDNTGNHCGLWVGDLKNSEYGSEPILEDPRAKSPDWSPVSREIAYMADPGDNWDLYIVNSDGSKVRRLTDDPAIEGLPAWSPDGKWIAFLSNRGGKWGIWLLHLATKETRQIFSFAGGSLTPPNRSPYEHRDWYDEQLSWSR